MGAEKLDGMRRKRLRVNISWESGMGKRRKNHEEPGRKTDGEYL